MAVVLAAVVPLYVAGDAARDRVVMRALERQYRAGGNPESVYIESGPGVPPGLAAVGRQPVEVVTRDELQTRHAGKPTAPALTTVFVRAERGLLGVRYAVSVSSSAVMVPGATSWPLGGSHTYYFRQWAGLPWGVGDVFTAF